MLSLGCVPNQGVPLFVVLQGRERRHSSPELELDVDPNALLETDALGLSKAEREAEEEAKRLEESRYGGGVPGRFCVGVWV